MNDKRTVFIESCQTYGDGRIAKEWGTAREDRLLEKCRSDFEKLAETSDEIPPLFDHQNEFVRYLASVNALELGMFKEEASAALHEIREGKRGSEHMSNLAYLVIDYLKL